jgi:YbgC/YbaW family acyl-CoA thioester hydrolase
MFETRLKVKLYDTDAAGIVFFGNYFRMAHDAYEALMQSIGCGIDHILLKEDYLLPVVHAEADYKKPVATGASIDVTIRAEVHETSFVLSYAFKDDKGASVATLQTVHVAIDREAGGKISLPEKLRRGLLAIC